MSVPAKLKVLTLIDHLSMGGAEMMLGQFAAAAPSGGIELHVACLAERDGNPAAEPLRAVGVEPVTLHAPERLGLSALSSVRRHIAELSPDLVHTHLGSSDFLGSLAARSLGVPAVSTLHAMAWGVGTKARAKFELYAYARRRGAARIIAVSESARRAYLQRGAAPPERVVTIHNGIEVIAEPGAGAATRQELGLRPEDLVVGMISALRPEKGHDIALGAVARLKVRFPRLRLLIVGDGAMADQIARSAAPLGAAVVIAGARYDVPRVLDAIDVCLHPSRADAFPTSVVEAMAASVPVLASAVGGIPEIILDGRTGVLVADPPTPEAVASSLARLLEEPARRRALASAGRLRYEEHFTSRPWVQRTRELYDAVLAENKSRRLDQ